VTYILTLILAFVGFILAYYIWKKKSGKEKLVCIIGKDCDKVIGSKYARTLGIDNTILGTVYFAFVFILSLIYLVFPFASEINFLSIGSLIITGAAALFSFYLAIVQVFILKELCEYCLASSFLSVLIFVVLVV